MINSVVLVGRITKDLELKYTQSGVAYCKFTLAINRTFTNGQGEREADFVNCTVWKKQAENLCNYMSKGSLIGVTGRIQTSNFEGRDGNRVFMTEVIADNVQFLESKKNANQSQQSYQQNPQNNPQEQTNYTRNDNDPFANDDGPIDVKDSDLPF